jgi:ATP-dependent Lon protease
MNKEEHEDQPQAPLKKRYNLRKRKPKPVKKEEAPKTQKSPRKKRVQPKKRLKKQRGNKDGDSDNDESDDSVDNHGNIKDLIDYDYEDDDEEDQDAVENTLEQIVNALRGRTGIRNIEFVIEEQEESEEEGDDEGDDEESDDDDNFDVAAKYKFLFGDIEEDDTDSDSEYIPGESENDENDDEEFENNVDEEDEDAEEDEEDVEEQSEEEEEVIVKPKRRRTQLRKQENKEDNRNKQGSKQGSKQGRRQEDKQRNKQGNRKKSKQGEQKITKPALKKRKTPNETEIKNIKNRFVIKQLFDLKSSQITPEILEYYDTLDTKMTTVPYMEEMKQFIKYSKKKQRWITRQIKNLEKKSHRKPFKFQLLDLKVSPELKAIIYEKVAMFSTMEATSGDYYKLQSWISSFFKLPFNRNITLPIKMTDEQSKIQSFLTDAKTKMDLELYGQNRAKDHFLQILCQWISNPNSGTNVIGLHGPPGVGKTSFIKNAISKILKRPFGFVSLGGATDSSLLDGFSYTYEGSNYGKIAELLIKTKCMNPVIYFDELDKVSATNKGDELWNVLTHLTDATQNSHFNDKYFAGVDLDLSKALFIFSFNDIEKINKILLDRLYVIYMDGYSVKEKTEITLSYLLPKTLKKYNLEGMIKFENNKQISYLIESYMKRDVKGVRDLQRLLDTMISRINVQRLMGNKLDAEYKLDNLEFPLLINREIIDKLLKDKRPERPAFMNYIV